MSFAVFEISSMKVNEREMWIYDQCSPSLLSIDKYLCKILDSMLSTINIIILLYCGKNIYNVQTPWIIC